MRMCITCRELQPVTEFRDRPHKKPYPIRTRVCKSCERERNQEPCPQCGLAKTKSAKRCAACDQTGRWRRPKGDTTPSVPCPDCGRPMGPKSRRCWDCGRHNRTDWKKSKTGPKAGPIVHRFISKCGVVHSFDDCIIWQGTVGRSGYGSFASGRTHGMSYRWAYELFVGDIPKGMSVDHLCRNNQCVNPFHLELCSRAENSRRAAASREQERRLWRHVYRNHPAILNEL